MENDSVQPPSADQHSLDYWQKQAAQVRRKMNLAWWLQLFLPAFCGISLLFACLVIVERRLLTDSKYVWAAYGATICLCAIVCYVLARKRFFTLLDSFVQLDAIMKLHNRLSSASAGVGSWPAAREVEDGLRWRSGTILWPLLLSLVVLGTAAWIPISTDEDAAKKSPLEKPLSWEQIEAAVEVLEDSEIVEEEALEQLKEQLEQLQQQSSEHWYDHSTLEAGDAMRRQMEHALEKLEKNLKQMESVLSELDQHKPQPDSQQLEDLSQQFGKALEGLELGELPLEEKALDKLKELDRDSLKGLSKEQLSKLKEQLRNGAAMAKEAKRRSKKGKGNKGKERSEGEDGEAEQCLSDSDNPFCKQGGDGQGRSAIRRFGSDGEGPGKGGITRGPGTAPLELEPRGGLGGLDSIEIIQGAEEPDEDQDYSTIYSQEEPEVDEQHPHSLAQSGKAALGGKGSSTVWKHSFSPDERDVLQQFFK